MGFTEKFNAALEESGITLAELGRRTGIDQNIIGKYKNGIYSPKPERRKELALALGKPEDYFQQPKKEPPKSTANLEHWRW